MTQKCPRCEKPIEGRGPNAKWCSEYCRGMAWHERTYTFKTPPPLERLLSNTERAENGCLEWTAATFGVRGYGAFWIDGKTIGAHRAHWMLVNGPIPDGLLLRHKCDNRKCLDLDHLETGTYADNARDAKERGRWTHGEISGNSKLTEANVREIRGRYDLGLSTQHELADEYGVTQAQIANVVTRKQWQHVA